MSFQAKIDAARVAELERHFEKRKDIAQALGVSEASLSRWYSRRGKTTPKASYAGQLPGVIKEALQKTKERKYLYILVAYFNGKDQKDEYLNPAVRWLDKTRNGLTDIRPRKNGSGWDYFPAPADEPEWHPETNPDGWYIDWLYRKVYDRMRRELTP